jgi:hypothetical protein
MALLQRVKRCENNRTKHSRTSTRHQHCSGKSKRPPDSLHASSQLPTCPKVASDSKADYLAKRKVWQLLAQLRCRASAKRRAQNWMACCN